MKPMGNRLVVADIGWAETIPEWLLDEIKSERIVLGLTRFINNDCISVGDAELCAYLYTLSLRCPLSHDYTEIYVYLCSQLMKRRNMTLAEFMDRKLEQGLSRDQQRLLGELRSNINRARGDVHHPLFDILRFMKQGAVDGKPISSEHTQLTLL